MTSDIVILIVFVVKTLLFIVLAITFLCWLHRISENLHVLSDEEMHFTPGWSVGWYFVPIGNLFKPFQVMTEIWDVAHRRQSSDHTLLGWWWSLCIIAMVLRWLSNRMRIPNYDPDLARTVDLATDLSVIAITAVALALVTRICKAYSANYDELGLTPIVATVVDDPETGR